MPFRETSPVEERIALFREYETGAFTVSGAVPAVRHQPGDVLRLEAAARERRGALVRGAEPRGRHIVRMRRPADLAERIVAMRRPLSALRPEEDQGLAETRARRDEAWPAASTIGDILKRAGLVEAARRRRRPIAQGEIVAPATAPNEEWSIDFKGWFRTRDGTRCDPLTITDTASRYLIEVRIVEPTWAGVQRRAGAGFRARSACPTRSAPTTARRSDRAARAGCRRCRCGG